MLDCLPSIDILEAIAPHASSFFNNSLDNVRVDREDFSKTIGTSRRPDTPSAESGFSRDYLVVCFLYLTSLFLERSRDLGWTLLTYSSSSSPTFFWQDEGTFEWNFLWSSHRRQTILLYDTISADGVRQSIVSCLNAWTKH